MRTTYDLKIKVNCCICSKELIPGDYVYGACHDCAKRAIARRAKLTKITVQVKEMA